MEDVLLVALLCLDSSISPVYRLYLDADLITERTFTWPHTDKCVRERLVLRLPAGQHRVWVDNTQSFELRNANLNNTVVELADNGIFTK